MIRGSNSILQSLLSSTVPESGSIQGRDPVGGLHWRAEGVIAAVFENLGYRARPLPPATRGDLLTGRDLADIGQCCPTSFTTGNLANFPNAEKQRLGVEGIAERYVHITAGACGACRFGQYHQSYELALRNLGLEYRTRPYEIRTGQTDAVVRESVDYLCEVFRRRPVHGRKWSVLVWHLITDYFSSALREIFRRFEAIELDRLQPKPVVKITGEFYLQTVPSGAVAQSRMGRLQQAAFWRA